MSLDTATRLGDALHAGALSATQQRLLDQLWLRSVLIEQWRRTRVSERRAFETRANRALAALDPL